jgi:hypothetical protein
MHSANHFIFELMHQLHANAAETPDHLATKLNNVGDFPDSPAFSLSASADLACPVHSVKGLQHLQYLQHLQHLQQLQHFQNLQHLHRNVAFELKLVRKFCFCIF